MAHPPLPAGRPFLVPQGLDDVVGSKRKRKGPRKLQDFLKWFSASCECHSSATSHPAAGSGQEL